MQDEFTNDEDTDLDKDTSFTDEVAEEAAETEDEETV